LLAREPARFDILLAGGTARFDRRSNDRGEWAKAWRGRVM
jgi:hypothetical protein